MPSADRTCVFLGTATGELVLFADPDLEGGGSDTLGVGDVHGDGDLDHAAAPEVEHDRYVAARQVLRAWCSWVVREAKPRKGEATSGLEPMLRVARTVRKLIRGILNYFRRRLTSGVIEGINSFVQAARARARGYRSPETFKTMIYLIAGRLQFSLPSLTHNG